MAYINTGSPFRVDGVLRARGSNLSQPRRERLTASLSMPSADFGGRYKIAGTVHETGTPNQPVSRRVLLIRERGMLVVGEQWSNAATGAYEFRWVSPAYRYTVLAYDHEHDYRAVVADNLTPVPI